MLKNKNQKQKNNKTKQMASFNDSVKKFVKNMFSSTIMKEPSMTLNGC